MSFRDFNENDLRNKTIIPLLLAMGYKDVIEYHGTHEKGKDIICWKEDELKGRVYYAVVVKASDIHGAVGKSHSASEVLYQARQVFSSPYRDIYGLNEVKIHRCIVITSKAIGAAAIESIGGDLGATYLERYLDFIDGNKLESLLKKHLPETKGIIGRIAYTYYPQDNAYYFYINPKRNPNPGPQVRNTEELQIDENFLINVDYNFDGTVHGIEILDWRPLGYTEKGGIQTKEIISEVEEIEEIEEIEDEEK